MKQVIRYIRTYILDLDKVVFSSCVLFLSLLIWLNYAKGLNTAINSQSPLLQQGGWFVVFCFAFGFPYGVQWIRFRKEGLTKRPFILLCLTACAVFSWKMSAGLPFSFGSSTDAVYWNQVVYWPFKLLVVTTVLWLVAGITAAPRPMYGLQWSHLDTKPYWIMLLMMLPLVAAAATQPDFLHTYPKLKNIAFIQDAPMASLYNFLFELSYGSDFFTIELFFRGFLVLGFLRWAGKDAILPMACFYCTIHFGKPLGECISSFFGGIILGTVTFHTRSIFGGLIVHLGIAWLMELGGYLGHQLK